MLASESIDKRGSGAGIGVICETSHSREKLALSVPKGGNLICKPLEMCCPRSGFLPPWRDGNDRRLEWFPIANDTSALPRGPLPILAAVPGNIMYSCHDC